MNYKSKWWAFYSWKGFRTKQFYCWGFAGAALVIMVAVYSSPCVPLQALGSTAGHGPDHSVQFKGVNHSSNNFSF